MNNDYTHITIVLDRSGSMADIKSDTIGGFNTFLADQQAQPGKGTITLALFNHKYEVSCQGMKLAHAQKLDNSSFVPLGTTALLDAIGRSIIETGDYLGAMPEEERPAKIIFVIMTDGLENASQEFTSVKINEMITHQKEAYNWKFVFLGANQDAFATAHTIGVTPDGTMTYAANTTGTANVFASLSHATASFRCGEMGAEFSFTPEDRQAQAEALKTEVHDTIISSANSQSLISERQKQWPKITK